MRDPEQRTIDGIAFEVTPLGYKKARQVFVRLTKTIGPALAMGAEGADVDMAAVLGVLTDRVSDADLEYFGEVFGSTTKYSTDGERWPFLRAADQETLFAGQLMLFFRWLAFCLEVNFSDFLDFLKSAEVGGGPGASA